MNLDNLVGRHKVLLRFYFAVMNLDNLLNLGEEVERFLNSIYFYNL